MKARYLMVVNGKVKGFAEAWRRRLKRTAFFLAKRTRCS